MATMSNFEQKVRKAGMDFHRISGDASALLASGPGLDLGEAGRNIFKMWAGAMRSFGALAKAYAEDFGGLLNLSPTDLIVNQLPGGLYGFDLAEKMGIPMVSAGVIPLTRTSHFPMVAFPPLPVPLPGYNRMTYRLAEQLVWQFYRPKINRWRAKTLGLPPQSFSGLFTQMQQDKQQIINGFSRHVVPPPPDWGPNIHLTGYWYAETPDWKPPQGLVDFLNQGEAPIFIGFGSMPIRNPGAILDLILNSAVSAGMRLVLHRGWGGLEATEFPESVFPIGFSDFKWLFPRMAAVVHHGGAGTTAYAMRAGVPSLVIPFVFDQFYWGRRTFELGIGPKAIPFKKLDEARLTKALIALQSQTSFSENAADLGERLRAENGLAHAISILEQIGA
jgi:UDP:flavonoid glycosyltransferase YjiC (YdhE family)